jgi:hypothetical protein
MRGDLTTRCRSLPATLGNGRQRLGNDKVEISQGIENIGIFVAGGETEVNELSH